MDSALSEAPSTAVLDRVEAELSFAQDVVDIDESNLIGTPTLKETPREPRTHKAIDGTLYIEILVKKDKGKTRTGWYWKHGTEFEV